VAEGETFGAAQVAAETNRRYRDKLRRPIDARAVSVTLHRLRDAGRLRLVREGKSYYEALYAKRARPAAGSPPSPEAKEV
jgi:DNA-binding transcriptional ArsR family regulator